MGGEEKVSDLRGQMGTQVQRTERSRWIVAIGDLGQRSLSQVGVWLGLTRKSGRGRKMEAAALYS